MQCKPFFFFGQKPSLFYAWGRQALSPPQPIFPQYQQPQYQQPQYQQSQYQQPQYQQLQYQQPQYQQTSYFGSPLLDVAREHESYIEPIRKYLQNNPVFQPSFESQQFGHVETPSPTYGLPPVNSFSSQFAPTATSPTNPSSSTFGSPQFTPSGPPATVYGVPDFQLPDFETPFNHQPPQPQPNQFGFSASPNSIYDLGPHPELEPHIEYGLPPNGQPIPFLPESGKNQTRS